MPGQSYYGPDPMRYYMYQQERRDEQLRNLMNMVLQVQQWKKQQTQQEFENELAQRQVGLKEKELSMQETPEQRAMRLAQEADMRARTTAKYRQPQETTEDRLRRIREESVIRAEVDQQYRQPPASQPSILDKKTQYWQNKLTRGEIDQKTYDKIMGQVMGEPTAPAVSPTTQFGERVRTANQVKKQFAELNGTPEGRKAFKYGSKEMETWRSLGIHADKPAEYSIAMSNMELGIGDEKDRAVVEFIDDVLARIQAGDVKDWKTLRESPWYAGAKPTLAQLRLYNFDKYLQDWIKHYAPKQPKEFLPVK